MLHGFGIEVRQFFDGAERVIAWFIVRSELEREQLEVLQKEINGLTKQQREVLYLKYYKKLDSDEIAEVMGADFPYCL